MSQEQVTTRTIATRTCHKISIVKSNVFTTTTTTTTTTYLGHGGDAGLHVHTNVHHTLAFLVVEFHVLEVKHRTLKKKRAFDR